MSDLNDCKYVIQWRRDKKKGYSALQQVTVYGLDAAEHVLKNVAPKDRTVDVIPVM
tara:strand:- start:93 stop:260 length:168 start_codon:yes stop_codon:yes gene_type:complete